MTRKCNLLISYVALVLIGLTFFEKALSYSRYSNHSIISIKDASRIQTGDLVFRRGRDIDSHVVLEADTAGQYSHVGLAWLQNGRVFILHALPDENGTKNGVVVEPLEIFSLESKASGIGVYRIHASSETLNNIVMYALSFKGRPFDTSFDISNQDRFYCTELVWFAYQHFGLQIIKSFDYMGLPMKPGSYILPGTIQTGRGISVIFQTHTLQQCANFWCSVINIS